MSYTIDPDAGRSMPTTTMKRIAIVVALVVALFAAYMFTLWFVIRQEVEADEVLVLVRKTGRTIPAELGEEFEDQIVLYPELLDKLAVYEGRELPSDPVERDALRAKVTNHYKGVVLEPLKEGRYYPNPYTYRRERQEVTVIDQGEVGVLIRKFGRPLKFPKTVATEPDERGPVAKTLGPGRHYINKLAYEVQKFPAIQIPAGHVGVVTLLSGDEPKVKNTYTVGPGEQGVQRQTLEPGLEYYNPYHKKIDIVDLRNRTYHMLGNDAIHFPSNDSFTISIEGTIEWSIMPERVADVTVAFGDEEDIINKIILPYARSISRIEGSKLQARDFISGKTRSEFQKELTRQLQAAGEERGIKIHSALVREIVPPPEVASLISQREQADQEIERSRNQIEEAKAEAMLVEQREMQTRNAALGDARRQTVSLTKEAEQRKIISVTQANRELEVARLDLESASKQAKAIIARGQADANVILYDYQARAEPLKNAVEAFGGGMVYAQHFFLQKIAPSIQSVLSNTEGPFADIFRSFQDFTPPVKPLAKGGDQ
ncbi:MAG TPA: SPFH domain-containing protein [Phycisphaerae bacterium]|nr:SPFH domain-containing protein [Phycisphaerae bacterium]